MIRVTNIEFKYWHTLADYTRVKVYEVTLQYQDALGSDSIAYHFIEDNLSTANIKKNTKRLYTKKKRTNRDNG